MDYSPWGCKESDMAKQLAHARTHTHTQMVLTDFVRYAVALQLLAFL